MKIFRLAVIFLVTLFFLVGLAKKAEASLLLINKEGKIILKVLSSQDTHGLEIPRREYLAIKAVASQTSDSDAKVSLSKLDGKVTLDVSSDLSQRSLDVTNYQEEIVEIEERPEVKRFTISLKDGKFIIDQDGISAETYFTINIDAKIAELTLETPSGFRYLSILPREAVETILRAKTIDRLKEGSKLLISEQNRELSYEIFGDRVIDVFNLVEYSIPVSSRVSASTGEILSVNEPTWLRILGFLFTS